MSELLNEVVVVLVEPQDPVNIAAAVRAMKNMGVARMRLVNPVEYTYERISGIAHDTDEIIAAITHHTNIEEACADCVQVVGFTARRRTAKRERISPKEAAALLLERAHDGPVALVFGREDRGLSNEQLDVAHIVVTIPTTGHASLNLAQAVLIGLYEIHLAAGDATRKLAPPRKSAPPATSDQYEHLFEDANRALEEIGFFKTRFRAYIMRSVRALAYRAAPDGREIKLLRAMSIEIVRTMERIRRGLT